MSAVQVRTRHTKHGPFCHVMKYFLNQNKNYILKNSISEDMFGNLFPQLILSQLYHSIIRIGKRLLTQRIFDKAYQGTNLGPVGEYMCILIIIENIICYTDQMVRAVQRH